MSTVVGRASRVHGQPEVPTRGRGCWGQGIFLSSLVSFAVNFKLFRQIKLMKKKEILG